MTQHKMADQKAQEFFDELWKRGDPWKLESSAFEQDKYSRQQSLISDRRYTRVLEVGCGAGFFTVQLLGVADQIVALDISSLAISRARTERSHSGIDYRVANIMDYDPHDDGPWDLVVISETVYYLGWLYPFYNVAWLAAELFDATRPGGRLLMSDTCGGVDDYLIRPWLIRTYRDMFRNVGYASELEETFRGTKDTVLIDVLISLLQRPKTT